MLRFYTPAVRMPRNMHMCTMHRTGGSSARCKHGLPTRRAVRGASLLGGWVVGREYGRPANGGCEGLAHMTTCAATTERPCCRPHLLPIVCTQRGPYGHARQQRPRYAHAVAWIPQPGPRQPCSAAAGRQHTAASSARCGSRQMEMLACSGCYEHGWSAGCFHRIYMKRRGRGGGDPEAKALIHSS